MKIYLVDDGHFDGVPGLVKEIVRDKTESFDLIKYTDRFGQDRYYVLDASIENDTVICKLVNRVALIAEKREDKREEYERKITA